MMTVDVKPDEIRTPLGWKWLALTSAGLAVALFAASALLLTDIEAGLFALGCAVAMFLVRFRTGLIGLIALALLFADTLLWMVPAAVSNLAAGDGLVATAMPTALTAVSAAGLAGAIGALLRRGDRFAPPVLVVAIILCVGGLVAGFVSTSTGSDADDTSVEMKDVRFEPEEIEVPRGGVRITVSNGDLFWHTFTIPEVGVDLRVPVAATRNVAFEAEAGIYDIVCTIPGHEQAGMTGTLTVR